MKQYRETRSANCPKPVETDENSVWVHENIRKIVEHPGEKGEYAAYAYDMTQYDKDEYIRLITVQNRALQAYADRLRLALKKSTEGG